MSHGFRLRLRSSLCLLQSSSPRRPTRAMRQAPVCALYRDACPVLLHSQFSALTTAIKRFLSEVRCARCECLHADYLLARLSSRRTTTPKWAAWQSLARYAPLGFHLS